MCNRDKANVIFSLSLTGRLLKWLMLVIDEKIGNDSANVVELKQHHQRHNA